MKSSVRILGIDPGTRVTGWGVVERDAQGALHPVAWGTIRLAGDDPIPARLQQIHQGVTSELSSHTPTVMAIEEAFAGRNVKSAIRLAEARAVCLLAGQVAGLDLHEVPPALVKKVLTGHGRAGKDTVREAVMRTLGWKEQPPAYDAADALAIALCVLFRLETPGGLRGGAAVGRRRRGRRWTLDDVNRIRSSG